MPDFERGQSQTNNSALQILPQNRTGEILPLKFIISYYLSFKTHNMNALKKINRHNYFHVALCLFTSTSQVISKCGKNKKEAHVQFNSLRQECHWYSYYINFDLFCDLLGTVSSNDHNRNDDDSKHWFAWLNEKKIMVHVACTVLQFFDVVHEKTKWNFQI